MKAGITEKNTWKHRIQDSTRVRKRNYGERGIMQTQNKPQALHGEASMIACMAASKHYLVNWLSG
nr:hypothetical protein [Heyndrickxia oleronia]